MSLFKVLDLILRAISLVVIVSYRSFFRLWLSGGCRYSPSCSEYGRQAFLNFPFHKAFYLTTKRIISCRPGSGFGHDPLPKEIK